MKTFTGNNKSPIGVNVLFADAPTTKIHVNLENSGAYRTDVVITLPRGQLPEEWVRYLRAIFLHVQRGGNRAINMDFANASKYFTLSQLRKVDASDAGICLHIFHTPKKATWVDRAYRRFRSSGYKKRSMDTEAEEE